MSAFCVFGVTRSQCKKMAEEKVESYDRDLQRHLTKEELAVRVEEVAQELFESSARTKQISPAFDAPQFAKDWIAVGLKTKTIRSPKIMTRGKKIDKKGAPKMNKKGEEVIGWIPYAG